MATNQNPWAALFPQPGTYQPGIIDSLLFAGLVGLPEAKRRKRENAQMEAARPGLLKEAGVTQDVPYSGFPEVMQARSLGQAGQSLKDATMRNDSAQAFLNLPESGGMLPSDRATLSSIRGQDVNTTRMSKLDKDEDIFRGLFGDMGPSTAATMDALVSSGHNRSLGIQQLEEEKRRGRMSGILGLYQNSFMPEERKPLFDAAAKELGLNLTQPQVVDPLTEALKGARNTVQRQKDPEAVATSDYLAKMLGQENVSTFTNVFGNRFNAADVASPEALSKFVESQLPGKEAKLKQLFADYNMPYDAAEVGLPTTQKVMVPSVNIVPGLSPVGGMAPRYTDKPLRIGEATGVQQKLSERRAQLQAIRELTRKVLAEYTGQKGGN